MPQYSDMLVYLRKRAGLSQQELADKLKITRSAISMYETGKREPDLETFEIFADFYNVDMNTLTGTPSSISSPASLSESGLSQDEIDFINWYRTQASDKDKALIRTLRDT